MPHSTQSYPFEGIVFAYVNELSMRLAGGDGTRGFVLRLDGQGSVRTATFEEPASGWAGLGSQLDSEGESFLLYDPFDPPEYACVRWSGVSQMTAERLLGTVLGPEAFQRFEHASSRHGLLPNPGTWPTGWSIVF